MKTVDIRQASEFIRSICPPPQRPIETEFHFKAWKQGVNDQSYTGCWDPQTLRWIDERNKLGYDILVRTGGTEEFNEWTVLPGTYHHSATIETPEPAISNASDTSETERPETERIREALKAIPASIGYDGWYRVGLALHQDFGGSDDGFRIWDQWSKTCPEKYKAKEMRGKWRSFRGSPNPVTIASVFQLAKEHGWEKGLSLVTLPRAQGINYEGHKEAIAFAAMTDLIETLERHGNEPDSEHFQALEEILITLEGMTFGTIEPKTHISSLDPGMGKTQAAVHYIRSFMRHLRDFPSNSLDGVSFLICVSTKAAISALVDDLGLDKADYAVFTTDDTINTGDPDTARVLLTTQQMIDSRLRRKPEEFFYRGKRRTVPIWDEAILPGRMLFLDLDDIARLLKFARSDSDLYQALDKLRDDIRALPGDQDTFVMPELERISGVTETDAREMFEKSGVPLDAISNLWQLSGKVVNVIRDHGRNTAVSYKDTFPGDFKPLVLDASARVRPAYQQWAESERGDIVELKRAYKDYSNLTIHVSGQSGGKWVWDGEHGENLCQGIADTINSKPDEEWLVVHHINVSLDVRQEIENRVVGRRDRVHYRHWGNERSVNDYVRVPNVILAGTLFQEESGYHALNRLVTKAKPEDKSPKGAIDQIKQGETADRILQAVLRGSARLTIDGKCAPCDTYVILAKRWTGMIPYIFPRAKVTDWKEMDQGKGLTGQKAQAFEYILGHIEPGVLLKDKPVRDALGEDGKSVDLRNFKRIKQHKDFKAALAEHGIYVTRGQGKSGFMMDIGAAALSGTREKGKGMPEFPFDVA